jgi:hypothetical protein
VPLKVQAPLNLSGARSTASHRLQSSMVRIYRRSSGDTRTRRPCCCQALLGALLR